MEVSISATGSSLQHVAPLPLPATSPLVPPVSLSVGRVKNCRLSRAATLHAEPQTRTDSPRSEDFRGQRHQRKLYSARQSAILEVQQCSDLDSALERLSKMMKVQDLNVILRHFGVQNRWQELSQLFQWMQQNGRIDDSSYSSYIKFIGRSSNPLKAIEIYKSIQDETTRRNVFICNSLLSSLVQNRKFAASIKLFDQMKHEGLTPDAVTYSTLLAGCKKNKDGYSKALELVQELKNNGLPMDNVVYGTLLAVCAAHNKLEEAESYFFRMKCEGYSPNLFHYSSLLNAYSINGDYRKADELVHGIKSAGLVPNKVMLTTLLKVYVRGGLFEKSMELLSKLEALGYAQDEIPYCLLMDGLAKAGRIQEAKSVFNKMEEKNVRSGSSSASLPREKFPQTLCIYIDKVSGDGFLNERLFAEFLCGSDMDGYAHSIMISAFCRGGLVEEAKLLARDVEARRERYDLVMLNTMLCAYCRAGEMESVMQMLRKMDELAISPDYNTFHILIKYFCREKLYLLAYKTMEDMHSKGYKPEEELCSSLIHHLGKTRAHSEAYSVYKMLRYSKRTMCKALHEKILHVLLAGRLLREAYVVVKDNAVLISRSAIKKFALEFMKSGNLNLVNDVMKVIHGSGNKIDKEVFQMAISRYVEQPAKKELFLQLLEWMSGQGYVVDSSTRNLILKNSHLFGRQLIAESLSKQHLKSKRRRSK